MNIQFEEMRTVFSSILEKNGCSKEDAEKSAAIFAQSSLDGVYSHGVNRFSRVISYIQKGYINPAAKPTLEDSFGSIERYNGNLGMGDLNAVICMDRAVELARAHGIGCVAIRNTNHWMRGGTYGWQAADAGCVGICFTNTKPNMPAWGAKDSRIGNNPFVLSIPVSDGNHVVVDCAMSQFSYGKIGEYSLKGAQLPYPGGYDEAGDLTTDPAAIEKTGRVLPIGYWKGSGLSLALDLIATVLSSGNSVTAVGKSGSEEYALSQVFIAINPTHFNSTELTDSLIKSVLEDVKASEPASAGKEIFYPGERTMNTRLHNIEHGIPVDDGVWNAILSLS